MVVTVGVMPGTGAMAVVADINRSGFGQRLLAIGSSDRGVASSVSQGVGR